MTTSTASAGPEADVRRGSSRLSRLSTLHLERRTQNRVAPDDLGQRGPQRLPVERAIDPEPERDVVRPGAGRQRLDEPHALL